MSETNGSNGEIDVTEKVASPSPAAMSESKDAIVDLRLSPRDLWFVAHALVNSPWGGGEQTVMALRTIHSTLKLSTVPLKERANARSATRTAPFTLPRAHVELIIRLLCGVGQFAFSGEAGPMMSDTVVALRDMITRADAISQLAATAPQA